MSDVARRHEMFMREALTIASEAASLGDVPVGCVIVRGEEIVGRGGNQIQQIGDPTRHAEIVAIEDAVRTVGEKFLHDCTLYVTLEPCTMCAGAIVLARIPNLVYGASDAKTGACRSVFELVDDPRLNHSVIVRTGILEQECSAVLSEFFEQQRSSQDTQHVEAPAAPATYGMLCLVPTPIGNLEDMTLRAVKTLRQADVIVCEDTRQTSPLLKKYDVPKKPLLSYHEHNERERAEEIVRRVRSGQLVALVSDAGMPGISDPGYRAVRACVEEGLPVSALPGASAVITAAAASGLPTDRILFGGFLPHKKGRMVALASLLSTADSTIILYESPHRITQLLSELEELAGPEREVVIARELSKLHEEYLRGTVQQLRSALEQRSGVKGECVVLIASAT